MDNQDFGQRQMFQGNWSCSDCGGAITELPFEPSGDRPLFCRDCHRKKRDSQSFGGGGGRPQRQMFQGNWNCSSCGTDIKELPFEPRSDQDLMCRDCYRQKKGY